MKDIQLTQHFKLSEFTRSATATEQGIDNTAPAEVVENLRHLCTELLEPMRVHFGMPIVISSGYRCPELNTLVKGQPDSQHLRGEAADLHIPTKKSIYGQVQDMATAFRWINYLLEQRFDQLILEHDRTGHYWLHISLKRNDKRNRQVYISDLVKK